MFLKKACFVVLLVLLAQIIVMRKLNRNKNKKQPTSSYRGYARKYAKTYSVVPTPTFRPKFYIRGILSEMLSDIDSTKKKTISVKETTRTEQKKTIKASVSSKQPTTKQYIANPKSSSVSESAKTKPKPSSVSKSPKEKPATIKPISTPSISSTSSVTKKKTEPSTSVITSSKIIENTSTVMMQSQNVNVPKTCYEKEKVRFTQYWIPIENQWDEDNHGQRVFLGGNEKVDLLDKNGNSLAIIPVEMYNKCKMEGTCLLENGDIINIDNTTESFLRVGTQGRENNIFGLGSGGQNLVPFVSVASNDLAYGQKLYIKELDGLDLGRGRKHNGCVRVDDDSWSFKGCQIDLFVLTYVDYLWLDLEIDRVKVQFMDCELKNYILKEDMESVKATNKEELIPSLLNAKYVEYN